MSTIAPTLTPDVLEMARFIVEHSPDCIKLLDTGARIVSMSPGGLAALGCTLESVADRPWPEFWPAASRAAAAGAVETALGGGVGRFQGMCPTATGEERWWDVSVSPLRGPGGAVELLLAVSRDISGRLAAQEALHRSESQFRAAFEHAPVGMALLSAEGRWQRVNRALCRMVGYDEHELVARDFRGITHPDDLPASAERLERLLSGKTAAEIFEKRYLHRDGRIVWVMVSTATTRDESGRVSGLVSQLVDITERKRTEEELRRFKQMADLASDAYFFADAAGRLRYVNGTGCRWLGLSEAQVLERTVAQIGGVADVAAFSTLAARLGRGETPPPFEASLARADGTRIEVELAVAGLEIGGETYVLGVARDLTARRATEATLRESEERFRAVFERAAVGVALASPEGVLTGANGAFCRMLGFEERELVGKTIAQISHPDDVPEGEEKRARLTEGKVAEVWYEKRYLHRSGRAVWAQVSGSTVRDSAGRLVSHLAVVVDVTARRAAEATLRASEERFRTLAALAPVGIFQCNPAGRTIFVNDAWCALAGMTQEQAGGYGWQRALHPEDRERVVSQWTAAAALGEEYEQDVRFMTPEGRVSWLSCSARPLKDDRGAVTAYIGTLTDITPQREAMEELRRSQERITLLASSMEDVISLHDTGWRTLYVSPSLERLLGYTPGDALSGDFGTRVHSEDRPAVERARDRNVRGHATRTQYRALHREGRWVWVETTATPIVGGDGKVARIACCSRNIDERRKVEEKLRASLDELRLQGQREAVLRRELDHRVRNNLASLLGLLSVYQRSGQPAQDAGGALRSMVHAMADVHDLISRTAGRPVALGELIGRLAIPYRGRVSAEGPAVAMEPARAGAMAMVLQELITNSGKHGALSAPTGRVATRWEAEPDGSIALWWEESGGPPASAPSARGAGLRLVEGFVRGDLRGDCRFDFNAGGFRCMLRAALGSPPQERECTIHNAIQESTHR
jgi:PAS domain S-box-containing protein